jgi:Tautomerase enzyme
MPLVRIDAIEGRSKQQIRDVLDATHRAVVAAFGVPLRDRYQIYQAHSETNLIAGVLFGFHIDG